MESFNDINELKIFLDKNILEHKVLIVRSKAEGSRILNSILRQGGSFFNIDTWTCFDIARKIVKCEVKNREESLYAMEKTLIDLKSENKLIYFKDIKVDREVTEVFYDEYIGLAHDLGLDALSNTKLEKLKELELIIEAYKKMLGGLDEADIYKEAIKSKNDIRFRDTKFIGLIDLKFTRLEKIFIEKVIKKDAIKNENIDLDLLKIKKENISFYCAYGRYNEVYNILREIKSKKIKFEDVLICTGNTSSYEDIVYELSEGFNLDISFSKGISMEYSKVFRIMDSYIKLVKSDYCINEFYEFLDVIDCNKAKIINYLSKLKITFVKNEYKEKFELFKTENILSDETIKECELIEKSIEKYTSYFNFKSASYSEFEIEIFRFLKDFTDISEEEEDKIKSIFKELNKISDNFDIDYISERFFRKLSRIKIESEDESAGRIHFTSIEDSKYTLRDKIYIIGLTEEDFLKSNKVETLISSDEYEKLLGIPNISRKEKLDDLKKFIINKSKDNRNISLSYSTHYLEQNKKSTLLSLFLEIFRIVKGRKDINLTNIEKFIGDTKSYIPTNERECLIFKEWLLYLKFVKEKNITIINTKTEEVLKDRDEHFKISKDNPISGVKLKSYKQCPYQYLLKHILKVDKIKDFKYEINTGISKLEFGNLVHSITENFYKRKNKDYVSVESIESDKSLLNEILDAEILRINDIYKFHNKVLIQSDIEVLKSLINKFLDYELKQGKKVIKTEFEVGNIYKPLKLDGNDIYMVGKIDRIEEDDNGVIIVDYKTGKTLPVVAIKDMSNTTKYTSYIANNIQLYAYKLALETMGYKIRELKYYHINKDNECSNKTFINSENSIANKMFLDEFKQIVRGINSNYFSRNDEDICKENIYCEYRDICARYLN